MTKTVTYCDRCKKEFEKDTRIDMNADVIDYKVSKFARKTGGFGPLDLCKDCSESLIRWLNGKEE